MMKLDNFQTQDMGFSITQLYSRRDTQIQDISGLSVLMTDINQPATKIITVEQSVRPMRNRQLPSRF